MATTRAGSRYYWMPYVNFHKFHIKKPESNSGKSREVNIESDYIEY